MSDANDFLKKGKGEEPAHEWLLTQLRFQNPDTTWAGFVEQKGVTGDTGPKGSTGPQGDKGPAG